MAIDLLNKKNSYYFQNAIQKNNSGIWEASIQPMNFSFTLEDLITYENIQREKLSDIRELISANEEIVKLRIEFSIISHDLQSASRQLADEKIMFEREKPGNYIQGAILIALLIVSIILISTLNGSWFVVGILITLLSTFFLIFFIDYLVSDLKKLDILTNKTTELKQKNETIKKMLDSLNNKIRQLEN